MINARIVGSVSMPKNKKNSVYHKYIIHKAQQKIWAAIAIEKITRRSLNPIVVFKVIRAWKAE